jgi:hypothetical protein
MINEHALSDASTWVNFDARKNPANVRGEPPGEQPTALPKPMRKTMPNERVKTGVAQHDFEARARSGITGESSVYFFSQVFQKHRNPYVC